MKIERPTSIAPRGKSGASASLGGSFSLGTQRVSASSASGGLSQASALGAALALQLESIDPERRRRQVQRGHEALDALEDLTLLVVQGGDPRRVQAALRQARDDLRERTGEAGLDDILAQIEQRVAVELAKLERSLRGRT